MVQDEAQSFDWSNSSATMHPFVFYYKDDTESALKNDSFVLISECNVHDKSCSSHLLQKFLIDFFHK